MFHFQTFQPSLALRECVHCYLVSDVINNDDWDMVHEALPMSITTLCFSDTRGSYSNRAGGVEKFSSAPDVAMVGQMLQKGESLFHCPSRSIIALFNVTGLYQLSGIPMSLITGRYSLDATSLFLTKELNECREQMFQYRDAAKAVSVLDHFLLRKFSARKTDLRNIDKVAGYINSRMGNVNLDWLTSQACMSVKTLERHFAEKIGLTPKYFARMIRFKHAFRMLEHMMPPNIIQIVETCRYTDQAHLIKEFKHFTDRTPKCYYTSEEVLSPFFLESVSKNDEFLQ